MHYKAKKVIRVYLNASSSMKKWWKSFSPLIRSVIERVQIEASKRLSRPSLNRNSKPNKIKSLTQIS